METLAVMLGCLAVFAAGMVVRCAVMALLLGLAAAPAVAFATGVQAAEACFDRTGGRTSIHDGLCYKATHMLAAAAHSHRR